MGEANVLLYIGVLLINQGSRESVDLEGHFSLIRP